MYGSKKRTEEIRSLRRSGGQWLKAQREAAGLSQRELAKEVGLPYYTFVSQVENGTARIPQEHYAIWAQVLNMPVAHFVPAMLRYYDPIIFDLLFPGATPHALPDGHKVGEPGKSGLGSGIHARGREN